MDTQPTSDETNSGKPEAPKSGFRVVWIFWGCGGMVLLFMLFLASCFVAVKGGMKVGEKEYGPACEEYLAMVKVENFKGAYAGFSEELKETIKEADYIAFDRGIHERLGNIESKSLQNVSTGVNEKGKWGSLTYDVKFEKGPGTIQFDLRKEGNHYKLRAFTYHSPVLAEAFKSQKP